MLNTNVFLCIFLSTNTKVSPRYVNIKKSVLSVIFSSAYLFLLLPLGLPRGMTVEILLPLMTWLQHFKLSLLDGSYGDHFLSEGASHYAICDATENNFVL